jgi:hypothetical protein
LELLVILTNGGNLLADDVSALITERPSLLRNSTQNLEDFVEGLTDQVVFN